MYKLSKTSFEELIKASEEKGVFVQGQILKLISTDALSQSEIAYLDRAKELFSAHSKAQAEQQQKIIEANEQMKKNEALLIAARVEAETAKKEAENAKTEIERELDAEQKRNKSQDQSKVIEWVLYFISGVMVFIVLLYCITLFLNKPSTVLENAIASLFTLIIGSGFGILATLFGIKTGQNQSGS